MNMEAKPLQFSGAANAAAGTAETPPATKKSGRARRLARATALFAVLGVVAYFTYPWPRGGRMSFSMTPASRQI